MKNNNLKKRVMRRIYLIYAKNFLLENGVYVTIVTIFLILVTSVSVADVMRNMPKDSLSSLSNFLLVAITNTETAVQVMLSMLALGSFTPLARLGFKATKKRWALRSPALQA